MAGDNQHHIPRFLQRGFGIPRSGKPKEIWTYGADGDPERGDIKLTASGHHFYSPPSNDSSKTLDDRITDTESDLAILTRRLRASADGTVVDAIQATDLVMKLTPRSSHLRSAIASGLRQIAASAQPFFSNMARMERMLGLDADEPESQFHQKFAEAMKGNGFLGEIGLPPPVLERAAYFLAKEQFDATMAETIPLFDSLFQNWQQQSDEMAKRAHVKALASMEGSGGRQAMLETFPGRSRTVHMKAQSCPIVSRWGRMAMASRH